ncbi:unnamed protein product [Nippostrongylus brasiliensis]|uniref:MFS domain-containing protein n=1 Tax=Nippostrongylus brasiliensis TaxID=27835 RepID=A0A158QYP7_NIPBR|nr:unnamed protein product [Nippostrongylus brasiliensis]
MKFPCFQQGAAPYVQFGIFSVSSNLDDKESPWRSIWISIFMQFIVGIQTSIYFMSMWPYLSYVDKTASVDFLGWVIAACFFGCSVANPLFGYWNQKTLSIKAPVIVGMIMMIIGQTIFGLLPLFQNGQKWIMLSARLLTGIGAGTLSVLRAFAATASTPRDRLRAVSFGTSGYVLGLSFGPAIQAVFTPIGEKGFHVGEMVFNMYTLPAFFMVLLSIVCCVIVQAFFKEEYAGIIENKNGEDGCNVVVPKFDVIPAAICIYIWMVSCMVATNIEGSTSSCLVSSGNSFLIGSTRIGKIEKRKQIMFGITVFLLFHIFNYPWPFYSGPLDYIPAGHNSSEIGGCLPSYKWCATTVRVPFPIYLICFIFFFGVSFPFTGSPSGTLYSQILGPRKQGMMQGIHSFAGSMAQCVAPVLMTYLFQISGYKYVMLTQIVTLTIALLLVIIFYNRLVPLRMKPLPGKPAKYKNGVFYAIAFPAIDERKSPWRSLWISIGLMFMVGVQISIYFMSMWPYLRGLDKSATVDFFGWVVAACSLGCSIANPLFGWWNQKTMSIKTPVIVGTLMTVAGQMIYGLLPMFSGGQKWIMMVARLVTGFGAGTLSVLRAYMATASSPKDRLRAVSFGTAGMVLGLSFGPALQAAFTPIGEEGFRIGPVLMNMYTLPSFFMVLLSILCCILVETFFVEEYAGIITEEDRNGEASFLVIPKFDIVPALICIYLWVITCMVAINIEVISTPWSTAMYNWKDSDGVLYNGLFQTASCLVSSAMNVTIGYTRIGKIEKRKQVLFGLTVFLLFHVLNYPWPFYPGPLDYIPEGMNSSDIGGCLPSYSWCATAARVPFPIYFICFVFFFGIAFPFVGSPSGALYSEILGPRKQGMMQGLHSFGGSMSQFVAPILTTYLFQHSGYKYIMVSQMVIIGLGLLLVILFYSRLVPLKIRPEPGKAAKYKNGVFYTL